jgi:hypothetical protein
MDTIQLTNNKSMEYIWKMQIRIKMFAKLQEKVNHHKGGKVEKSKNR